MTDRKPNITCHETNYPVGIMVEVNREQLEKMPDYWDATYGSPLNSSSLLISIEEAKELAKKLKLAICQAKKWQVLRETEEKEKKNR